MLWRFASRWKTVITMTVFLHWIFGEMYNLDEFQLIRVEGRYYDNVYTITYMDNDAEVEFVEKSEYAVTPLKLNEMPIIN